MTYELPESPERGEAVERTHDDLATEHGRDNVFVTEADGFVVSLIGEDMGDIEPKRVAILTGDRV